MKAKIILLFTILFLTTPIFSEPSYNTAIEEGKTAALDYIDKKEATAISVTLVGPEGIIWSQAFGLADPTTGQKATEDTLFGIGSVSKLIATIAVMKLVDNGLLALDTPIVEYLPNFSMRSPEYKKITVRMLLNHSAGFPGTDYRNLLTPKYDPNYLNQMLHTLSQSRLKAPPGFMNVYCNDCFTLIEALVLARTGKGYAQFVEEEILKPIEMTNTHYPTNLFSGDAYAKAYINGKLKPQEIINAFATGGAYSTTKDLAKIAQMLLNKGKVGNETFLTEASVAEMAKDQTLGTFNPVHNNTFAYGLGWDSVTQPGLLSVGFDGWAKGGDTYGYGAMIIVSPKAKLGVAVLGVSNFGSERAKVIAERILLRALAENHLIPEFPSPLPPTSVIPSINNPSSTMPNGQYALSQLIMNFENQGDGTVKFSTLSDQGWSTADTFQAQQDGWFINFKPPFSEIKVIETEVLGKKTKYLIGRRPGGYGHYLDTGVSAQKLEENSKEFPSVWKKRLHSTWLVVNTNPDNLKWDGFEPRLSLHVVPGKTNLLAFHSTEDGTLHVQNPSSNNQASMMLIIPQLSGRDLYDLVFFKYKGEEWVRYGSTIHQPMSQVPVLALNKSVKVTIEPQGYAKWMAIKSRTAAIKLTIDTKGDWLLYDSKFQLLEKGKGKAVISIPKGKGLNYLTVFGKAGQVIRLTTHSKSHNLY